ncbi:type II secretion system F family protein [Candidatus Micrarchaeota archaeon]|nr:type II secretion system F family protein [Candidatus Micrarchaeota archaeon]
MAGFLSELKKAYWGVERFYESSGIALSLPAYLAVFALIAAAAAVLSIYALNYLPTGIGENTGVIGAVAFVAFLSLAAVIPLSMRNRRIEEIEENLPDALRHLTAVLKAGGTIENAVEEASKTDYGELSRSLRTALGRMQRGKSFDDVIVEAGETSGSRLYKRVVQIIRESRRAGAGIADVMSAIAEDAKDVAHIRRERIARTTMHVLFLYLSSLLLSPFIFGFTITVVAFIGTGISCAVPGSKPVQLSFLNTVLTVFLSFSAVLASIAIGVIREGSASRYVVRAPAMVLIALLVFEFGKRFALLIIGGGATTCG